MQPANAHTATRKSDFAFSNLPLFSNKLDPRRRANWPAWVVLAAAVILPWGLGWAAVPVVMVLYVLSGLVWWPVSDQFSVISDQ